MDFDIKEQMALPSQAMAMALLAHLVPNLGK